MHNCGYLKFIAAYFYNLGKMPVVANFEVGRMLIFFRDLFLWWQDILRRMFPVLCGHNASGFGQNLISVCADGIRFVDKISARPAETLTIDELESQLRRPGPEQGGMPKTVTLRIESDRAVVRRLSSIALPATRHRASALLDIDAATPFHLDDVHVLTLRRLESVLAAGSTYAIVKRAILDPLRAVIKETGTTVAQVEIEDGVLIHPVSLEDQRQLFENKSLSATHPWIAAAFVFVLLVIATLAHVATQYSAAMTEVESSIEKLGEDAKIVRQQIDQRASRIAEIQSLRKSMEERKLISFVWEELAEVLPDSSYITDLAIKDNNVSITGHSAAASSIIVALENSDVFEQALFTAPVVKIPGNAGDRFVIGLTISGKKCC